MAFRFNTMFLYRHKANTDIAFKPIKTYYIPQLKVFKVKVEWWNIVPSHEPYSLGVKQNIVIKEGDLANWQIFYNLMWSKCLIKQEEGIVKLKVINKEDLVELKK